MDTIVSRMMQLLGVILVLGMVVSGVEAAQVKEWGSTVAFLLFGVVSAGIFTVIWTMTLQDVAGSLGPTRKRSEVTSKSAVTLAVGMLALFTCCGFVTAGLAAAHSGDYYWARWFYALGSITTAILCVIWSVSECSLVAKFTKTDS